jgi:serine/threonine protein kinase
MNYFLDRAIYGSNSLIVDVSKPLGKGAQAAVYACQIDGKPYAVKIFHSSTHGLNVNKINAMINNPPSVLEKVIDGVKYPKYSWPLALIRNQANAFVGYLMPLVDLKDSFTLDHYYDINLIKRLNSSNESALSFKVEIAKNLAELVADLHSHKHYFVDFKPQNIRVFKGTHAVTLIDCDGFSINGKENSKFPAELMSTDYIAPEVFKNKLPAQQLGEDQDLYALATIIFQLFNGGIHPFQGILKGGLNAPTNDEKASLALYPHGIASNSQISPRPQSVHGTFLNDTRLLFDKAFVGSNTQRPTANMWFVHLSQILDTGQIVRCSKFPSDVKHMRFKNMDCPECHRQGVVLVTPQVPKSKVDYSRLNTSRPSGVAGGGYKSPSSSGGGMTFGEKVFFGVLVAFFVLIAGSQCSSKNAPAPSSYTPAPAHTPPPPPPPPPVRDIGWASVYYSDTTRRYTWFIGATNKEKAQQNASALCNSREGNCKEWATRQSKCIAIFVNVTSNRLSLAFGDSKSEALAKGRAQCEKNGGVCFLDDTIGVENSHKCDSWSQ